MLLLFSVVLVGATWFCTDLAFDFITDSLLRFESEPPEGFAYWEDKAFREQLPGLLGVWGIALAVGSYILWLWICWIKELGRGE